MLRIDKVIKPWKESACLNDHINLYGFWNEMAFLTKSGDVGMVLSVPGVDYESLDRSEQEYAVKRLEAALKAFGPDFHVYQYLFKSNRPDIPFAKYDDPIVATAIEQRHQFFEAKRDHLYQVEIFYCVLLEGARSKTGMGAAFGRLFRDPAGAIGELKAQFTSDNMKTLLRTQIERDIARLEQRVQAFARQLSDFMQIEVLNWQKQFTFLRRLLNYDDWRIAGRPQSTQFLDYQIVNSNIEAERDHLRVGDHIVRVLTMKESITETRPLALDALLKIPANFRVITEWTPLATDKARKEVNKRRRLLLGETMHIPVQKSLIEKAVNWILGQERFLQVNDGAVEGWGYSESNAPDLDTTCLALETLLNVKTISLAHITANALWLIRAQRRDDTIEDGKWDDGDPFRIALGLVKYCKKIGAVCAADGYPLQRHKNRHRVR